MLCKRAYAVLTFCPFFAYCKMGPVFKQNTGPCAKRHKTKGMNLMSVRATSQYVGNNRLQSPGTTYSSSACGCSARRSSCSRCGSPCSGTLAQLGSSGALTGRCSGCSGVINNSPNCPACSNCSACERAMRLLMFELALR